MSGPRVAVRSSTIHSVPGCMLVGENNIASPSAERRERLCGLGLARWVAWWSVCLVRADSSVASVTGQPAIG